jgi:Skp family chaperone for outer membrane proteins
MNGWVVLVICFSILIAIYLVGYIVIASQVVDVAEVLIQKQMEKEQDEMEKEQDEIKKEQDEMEKEQDEMEKEQDEMMRINY